MHLLASTFQSTVNPKYIQINICQNVILMKNVLLFCGLYEISTAYMQVKIKKFPSTLMKLTTAFEAIEHGNSSLSPHQLSTTYLHWSYINPIFYSPLIFIRHLSSNSATCLHTQRSLQCHLIYQLTGCGGKLEHPGETLTHMEHMQTPHRQSWLNAGTVRHKISNMLFFHLLHQWLNKNILFILWASRIVVIIRWIK